MATATINFELAKTARLIPGYDPFATAGNCVFDEERAQFAIDFIQECCSHVKGALARTKFHLEPWERAIIANLFGWLRPDGTRRYREAFVFLPRKNGKTTLIATIIAYMLYCDGEAGAELYSAAADRDQARLVFEQVRGMISNDPDLLARAKVYQHSVVVGDSSYKAISAEAGTKHGFHSHLIVIDELHAQPTRELVDVLMTSTGARTQPLVIHITTSDFERPSICNEKHDYASKVRDGIIEDVAFLPVIYEASRDDDWKDPKTWAKANPNLGVSVSEEYLARECQRAQDSPAYENTFKRLHLNIRTEQDVRWLQMDRWDACNAPIDLAALKGRECYCGLDLATTTDIAALVLAFKDDDGRYVLVPRFWVPRDRAVQREKRDRVPYVQWIREGWITATEGDAVDYATVERDILELSKQYKIVEIAADPWNATQVLQSLAGEGLNVFEHRQGYVSMSSPTKEFEKAVLTGNVVHGGNPVLRWMASNVTVETDASANLKPSKKKSTEKIDGIVAAIMAVGRASMATDTTSYYETHDLDVW